MSPPTAFTKAMFAIAITKPQHYQHLASKIKAFSTQHDIGLFPTEQSRIKAFSPQKQDVGLFSTKQARSRPFPRVFYLPLLLKTPSYSLILPIHLIWWQPWLYYHWVATAVLSVLSFPDIWPGQLHNGFKRKQQKLLPIQVFLHTSPTKRSYLYQLSCSSGVFKSDITSLVIFLLSMFLLVIIRDVTGTDAKQL